MNNYNRNRSAENRISFSKARTKYNNSKKKTLFAYRYKEGQRLDKMASLNPRKFWKTVKSKNKKGDLDTKSLHANDLFEHFKSLFDNKNENHTPISDDSS